MGTFGVHGKKSIISVLSFLTVSQNNVGVNRWNWTNKLDSSQEVKPGFFYFMKRIVPEPSSAVLQVLGLLGLLLVLLGALARGGLTYFSCGLA